MLCQRFSVTWVLKLWMLHTLATMLVCLHMDKLALERRTL